MQNRIYNTKAVIEAGLISALIVVIMLINVYVPIFSIFGMFILPVPVTVLYIRHNYKVTLVAVIVSAIIIAMVYNPLSALTSGITIGFVGMTLGHCVKHKKKASTTVLFLSIALIIVWILSIAIYTTFIDTSGIVSIMDKNIKAIKENYYSVRDIYVKMGVSKEKLAIIDESYKGITTEYMIKFLPYSVTILSFCLAYLNYVITKSILRKFRYDMEEFSPFSNLYINTRVGTFVVVCLIIGMLLSRNKISVGEYVTNYSQILLQLVFALNGLAFSAYYLRNRFHMSKMVTALILIYTGTTQFYIIYMYLGFIDMIIDFRKLDPYRRLIKE